MTQQGHIRHEERPPQGGYGITIENADRIPNSGLRRGTYLQQGFGGGMGLLSETDRGVIRSVVVYGDDVRIVSGNRNAVQGATKQAPQVADAVRNAFRRAIGNGIDDQEALQFERLRQTITVAAENGFSRREIGEIDSQAAQIPLGLARRGEAVARPR